MPRVDAHIPIERPADVVFDYLADLRNWPAYSSAVETVTSHAAPSEGARSTVVLSFLGKRFTMEVEVAEYGRPERFAMRSIGGSPFPLDGEFTIEAVDSGACVVHGETGADGAGFLGIASRALAPIERRQFRRDLETMRDLLEAGA